MKLKEDGSGRKRNFKPAVFPHYHSAADTAVLADREEFEFAILKGDYLLQDDVRRWLGEMITAVKVELMNSAVRTASSLVGLTAGEILDRLRTENTRVLRHLHEEPWDSIGL